MPAAVLSAGAILCICALLCALVNHGGGNGGNAPDTMPPGAPPLPMVKELAELFTFVRHSLDDIAEDAVKFALLSLAYAGGRRLAGGRAVGGVAVVLALYHHADAAGDYVGDVVQDALGTANGGESDRVGVDSDENARSTGATAAVAVARLSDDVVEDAFKIACVGAHAAVGALLQRHACRPLLASAGLLGGGAPAVQWVARGVCDVMPFARAAGKYNECNSYGDQLGDFVEGRARALLAWALGGEERWRRISGDEL